MPEDLYEVVSLGARYWFALLGVLIVWRSFSWLRKDRRIKHRRLRQLPDAGMIGEMVVVAGSDQLPEGMVLPVPREGVLGYLRSCDLVVPAEGVAAKHCDFTFRDGLGLLITPRHRCTVTIDDTAITPRTHPADHPMHHGSRLTVGAAVLRLRLFAGLKTTRHSAVMEDAADASSSTNDASPSPVPDTPTAGLPYPQAPSAWPVDANGYPVSPAPYVDANGYPMQPAPYVDANGYPVSPAPYVDANGYPVSPAPYVDANGYPVSPAPYVDANGYPVQPAPYAPVDSPMSSTPVIAPAPEDAQPAPRHRFGRRNRHA